MLDKFDPDERFKLDVEPEEAIRRLLAGEKKDEAAEDEPETPEDDA